jgi:hypothetical protein
MNVNGVENVCVLVYNYDCWLYAIWSSGNYTSFGFFYVFQKTLDSPLLVIDNSTIYNSNSFTLSVVTQCMHYSESDKLDGFCITDA